MRFFDDSIYITTCKSSATKFITAYEEGFRDYGAHANRSKTKMNFFIGDRPSEGCTRTPDGNLYISWYGLLINTNSFEFQSNYEAFQGEGYLAFFIFPDFHPSLLNNY